MSEGEKRRQRIAEALRQETGPIAGAELARRFGVSRQVIVQDVALLRADGCPILSTYRGYVLSEEPRQKLPCVRVFPVNHSTEDILDEFYTVVDLGGMVLDVFVEHQLYGQLRADLMIKSRLDAAEFIARMEQCTDRPLKELTGGSHYHTVAAESEKNLDLIEEELRRKGYWEELPAI